MVLKEVADKLRVASVPLKDCRRLESCRDKFQVFFLPPCPHRVFMIQLPGLDFKAALSKKKILDH